MTRKFKYNYQEGDFIKECIFISEKGIFNGHRLIEVKCKCGTFFTSTEKNVRTGHTNSCGCLRKEMTIKKNTTHGLRHTVEYGLWLNMKQRCCNENYHGYKHWGGRGIKVCDRWLNNFENFYEDMGAQPDKKMGIDRINNNEGYSKENCRWATQKEQANNKRNTRYIEFNGEIKPLMQWVDVLGLNKNTTKHYLYNTNKSIEFIFSKATIGVHVS